MAIDYRVEWEKFKVYYRGFQTTHNGQSISDLMDDWIKDVINSREKLVQEYLRSRITTEIVGQDKDHFKVAITNAYKGHVDTIYVYRTDFANWLNKKKGGK